MPYAHLMLAIVAEVIATNALKASAGFTRLAPSMIVVLGYGVSFWFLAQALKSIPVGVAYAIWSGLGIVLVAAVAALVFREVPNWQTVAGLGLIVAGVVVVQVFGGELH